MRPAFKTIAVTFLVCGFTIALASPIPEEKLEKEFTGRDIVCGSDVNYPTTISSPNYPGPYDSYFGLCRWKISTPDDSVQLIKITVRVLDTPTPGWGGCVANLDDILVLRGMPGLESHMMSARFCGSSRPANPLYHLGSTVYVLFVMNSMDPNYSGFTLDVEFLSGNPPSACEGGLTFPAESGSIASPNFPNNYDNSLSCSWIIEATVGNQIRLSFVNFTLEQDFDYLQIYDNVAGTGNPVANFTGTDGDGAELVILGNSARLDFTTDGSVTEPGFSLNWSGELAGIDTNLLTMPGVTCSASSIESLDFVCENAYNGVTEPGYGNEWASNLEGDGAWLEVTFPMTVLVQSVEIWQRCHVGDQYGRFQLTFSDGSQQEVTTPCNGSGDYLYCTGVPSEYRQLTPVLTSSVRITGYDVCNASIGNGGIREMRING